MALLLRTVSHFVTDTQLYPDAYIDKSLTDTADWIIRARRRWHAAKTIALEEMEFEANRFAALFAEDRKTVTNRLARKFIKIAETFLTPVVGAVRFCLLWYDATYKAINNWQLLSNWPRLCRSLAAIAATINGALGIPYGLLWGTAGFILEFLAPLSFVVAIAVIIYFIPFLLIQLLYMIALLLLIYALRALFSSHPNFMTSATLLICIVPTLILTPLLIFQGLITLSILPGVLFSSSVLETLSIISCIAWSLTTLYPSGLSSAKPKLSIAAHLLLAICFTAGMAICILFFTIPLFANLITVLSTLAFMNLLSAQQVNIRRVGYPSMAHINFYRAATALSAVGLCYQIAATYILLLPLMPVVACAAVFLIFILSATGMLGTSIERQTNRSQVAQPSLRRRASVAFSSFSEGNTTEILRSNQESLTADDLLARLAAATTETVASEPHYDTELTTSRP